MVYCGWSSGVFFFGGLRSFEGFGQEQLHTVDDICSRGSCKVNKLYRLSLVQAFLEFLKYNYLACF